MGDPSSIANAFVSAYNGALDKGDAQTLSTLFRDASTLSFEGETLKGKQPIVQKLTSLGLPPNPMRRVTVVDAQPSCCGNGALIVFVMGEWMNNQYQEVHQLVPESGSYYIHNCVFRVGQNNAFNVPPEGQELTKTFIQHYYQMYDGGLESRNGLKALYTSTSVAQFENNVCTGPDMIISKMAELPLVQHDPNMACDVQLINGLEIVLIFLSGQLSIDNTNPMKFSELFIIQKNGGSYVIGNQAFRLNYG